MTISLTFVLGLLSIAASAWAKGKAKAIGVIIAMLVLAGLTSTNLIQAGSESTSTITGSVKTASPTGHK